VMHARCFTAEAVQHDAFLRKALAGNGALAGGRESLPKKKSREYPSHWPRQR